MAKVKTQYVCTECGYTAAKWLGQCPSCKSWNTLEEESVEVRKGTGRNTRPAIAPKIVTFDEIPAEHEKRRRTGIGEFDRVLGGGAVVGGITLAAGEPGIGKSTLFLQIADRLGKHDTTLYVSGEESPAQIKLRANRLKIEQGVYLLAETEVSSILEGIYDLKPKFVVLDSVQTLYDAELSSAPGSVTQVRTCAAKIAQAAKKQGFSVFMIGHVTKEGAIAGPRVLEHLVDTVLYFEGERTSNLRILRAVKNRFGSTDEIGVFEMKDTGMKEVKNPSALFDDVDNAELEGVSVFAATQGTRPMLLEIQALCSHTQLNIPRRLSSGLDINRLYMICAVLEKKIGLKLYNQDIFLNVAGGIKIKEHASDLSVAVSIVSSLRSLPVPKDVAFVGEIGLSGEIRYAPQLAKRIAECAKLGFKKIFVPAQNTEKKSKANIDLIGVRTLSDVLAQVF